MKRKIIGVTVGSPLPKPNLMQNDPKKGDYVKGKEEFLEQIGAPESGGNVNYGAENAGKLLYVGADGYATVLTLGAGLKIVNGVLTITSAVVTAAICGESTCGNTICGGA